MSREEQAYINEWIWRAQHRIARYTAQYSKQEIEESWPEEALMESCLRLRRGLHAAQHPEGLSTYKLIQLLSKQAAEEDLWQEPYREYEKWGIIIRYGRGGLGNGLWASTVNAYGPNTEVSNVQSILNYLYTQIKGGSSVHLVDAGGAFDSQYHESARN